MGFRYVKTKIINKDKHTIAESISDIGEVGLLDPTPHLLYIDKYNFLY